jgi:hypothetical protein
MIFRRTIEQSPMPMKNYQADTPALLLDLVAEPSPKLLRPDDHEPRRKILALTQPEAKGLGIGRSTLHYLRNSDSI